MALADYLISQTLDGQWTLRHDGRPLATFPDKNQAIRWALVHRGGKRRRNWIGDVSLDQP
jgi:hypothetical protein